MWGRYPQLEKAPIGIGLTAIVLVSFLAGIGVGFTAFGMKFQQIVHQELIEAHFARPPAPLTPPPVGRSDPPPGDGEHPGPGPGGGTPGDGETGIVTPGPGGGGRPADDGGAPIGQGAGAMPGSGGSVPTGAAPGSGEAAAERCADTPTANPAHPGPGPGPGGGVQPTQVCTHLAAGVYVVDNTGMAEQAPPEVWKAYNKA